MQRFKLSIVVVTMDHLSKLKYLLEALAGAAKPKCEHEVIIIDNCSKDGTVEYVQKNYLNFKVYSNDKVAGFAENNNRGFAKSSGDYIFICNPDIIPKPGSIDALISSIEGQNDVGIVCPKLLNTDGTVQLTVRNFINLRVLLARLFTLGSDKTNNKIVRKYLMADFDRNKTQFANWAMGAALMLKRELYNELKGFDERFFLYVEDVDLCLRSWKLGKKVLYFPDSEMIHDHQRASVKKIGKKTWLHLRSMAYFIIKHKMYLKEETFT